MKRFMVGALIGAVLGVGTWFLLANSHADFFGATAEQVNTADSYCQGQMSMGKDMISLMYLDDTYDQCYNYELSGMGWATAILIIGVAPLGLGMLISRKLVK